MADRIAGKMEVLMPYGESLAGKPEAKLTPRPQSLAGAVVGIVWNGWHCMEVMTNELRRILVEEFGARSVEAIQTGTTLPMSPAQLAHAREHWGGAIVGLAT